MNRPTDYWLVTADTPDELNNRVCEIMQGESKRGWQPFASPFVWAADSTSAIYGQAMVTYSEESKE